MSLKKKEIKEEARGVKNFDLEKQQWHQKNIEVRPRMKEAVHLLN